MVRLKGRNGVCTAALVCVGLWAAGPALAGKKVVRWVFDGPVTEAPLPSEFALFSFGGDKAKTLREWVNEIDKAGKDGEVAAAVLLIETPQMGLAQVEELSRAMKRFREKGKKIYCYLDEAGNGTYALASNADHVTLAENSSLDIVGLNAEMMFFKNLFDKIGLEADILHCGAYKSAGEPFYRTEPSKEAAEMMNWLLDGIYDRWVKLIAEGRKQTPEQIKAAVDAAPLEAKEALSKKLIDDVSSFPAFKQLIHKEYGQDVEIVKDYGKKESDFKLDMNNPFAMFQMFSDLFNDAADTARAKAKPGLALIYIDGMITTGKSEPATPFGGGGNAGSTTIRAAFEQAREDEAVKAVVVRVDSPGGSAVASDIMWEAAKRCAAEKPVIVSMGNVAGSGGYYVSIPGDVIFAEATTLTGSIGVVGGKIIVKGLTDWAGITFTEFPRGKHAGLMSTNRKWTDEERAVITKWLNSVYEQFKGRVTECRGKKLKDDLEKLAGGRVYTGQQALERGLVDEIGGLHDAMKHAAEKGSLGSEYEVYVLPKPKGLADIFAEIFGQEKRDEWEITAGRTSATVNFGFGSSDPALAAHPVIRHVLPLIQPLAGEHAQAVLRAVRSALLLGDEHVAMFMPFELRVR